MGLFSKKNKESSSPSGSSDEGYNENLSKQQIKQATRTRFSFDIFCSFCLLITVIFLIIVEVANTSTGMALTNVYFIRLNLSHVVPTSVANATLLNSIAQSLGLHDYYQVGLWNYCQGYFDSRGTDSCSPTMTLYYFQPVAIIRDQLIAGASITLPDGLDSVLNIIKIVSQVMFGLFLTGACLSFVLIFVLPLSVRSRWWAFGLGILAFLNAICVTAAAIIATALFVIMKDVFVSNEQVNIEAKIGTTMFACMWVAAAFSLFAWLIQMGQCCCCASRRDVRTGRKKGRKVKSEKYESS